jgi:predicted aspartyl protease
VRAPAGLLQLWLAAARLPASCLQAARLQAACFLAAHPAAGAGCALEQVARVPLRDDDGFLSIPASIAGQPVRLMIDTGSDAGLITPQAARGLGLVTDPDAHVQLQGTGGIGRPALVARAPGLAIGALRLGGVLMPVGVLPALPRLTPPVVGFLGGDVLSRFDLDIDVPHATLSLYRVSLPSLACAEPPAWTGSFTTVPLTAAGVRLSLTATLNGHPVSALLDTGARSHVVSEAAARRIGVAPGALAAEPGGTTSGVDMREEVYHWHRFASLVIGGQTRNAPVLTVVPLSGPFDMLLGTDWLRSREIWISYANQRMFLREGPAAHSVNVLQR